MFFSFEKGSLAASELKVDLKISANENLEDGELKKEDFEGYASRFAHGEVKSPFDDFEYYAFSKLQKHTLSQLTSKASEYLEAFDISEARTEFFQDEFREAFYHFVNTVFFYIY